MPQQRQTMPSVLFPSGVSVGTARKSLLYPSTRPKNSAKLPFCFLFLCQCPFNWYYLPRLRQRDKEVKEESKSRWYIYLYLWILRWHFSLKKQLLFNFNFQFLNHFILPNTDCYLAFKD